MQVGGASSSRGSQRPTCVPIHPSPSQSSEAKQGLGWLSVCCMPKGAATVAAAHAHVSHAVLLLLQLLLLLLPLLWRPAERGKGGCDAVERAVSRGGAREAANACTHAAHSPLAADHRPDTHCMSLGLSIRLTSANLRVFFALPMMSAEGGCLFAVVLWEDTAATLLALPLAAAAAAAVDGLLLSVDGKAEWSACCCCAWRGGGCLQSA